MQRISFLGSMEVIWEMIDKTGVADSRVLESAPSAVEQRGEKHFI
jgi:hypothetical protein